MSPLGRNRIKHHICALIPHHRWADIELKYGKTYNYSSKLNSLVGSNLIRR
jgi:hypothetical protein